MMILLIEDHQDIAGVIFDFLGLKGYTLDYASHGNQGLQLACSNYYDVIILDVMLPQVDGLTLCKTLRENGINTPILMLTARDTNEDILAGFEHGADDYLVKPFDLHILEARIKALYKRKTGVVAVKQLTFSGLSLDLTTRIVRREGREITLNQTLFTILKIMMLRAPNVTSREEVINEVWQENEPEGDILRGHIYLLRNEVDKPFQHHYIKTIPKVGYQLVAAPVVDI